MKLDMLGRLRNMDLPDGKTAVLYSVYEAVSNSIHAIIDRFGEDDAAEKGTIDVDIELNRKSEVQTIVVTDNGVGFTPDNVDSFDTSDSRYKYQRGGKGVGRFVWFKTFSQIHIESTFKKGRSYQKVSFNFDPLSDRSRKNKRSRAGVASTTGSRIQISSPRTSQGAG